MIRSVLHAVRALRNQAGSTLVVLATLTLGIGASVAIFSAVNGLLLRPLPYPEADRIMQLWEYRPQQGLDRNTVSPADFLDWREGCTSFEAMAAITGGSVSLTGTGDPEELPALLVTEDYFDVLQVRPDQGRGLFAADYVENTESVAVIGYGLWQRRFGGAADVLGRSIRLDGTPHTVVGIMPAGLRVAASPEIWLPMGFGAEPGRGGHFLRVLGRLASGASVAQATAELDTLSRALEQMYPEDNTGHYAGMGPYQDEVVRRSRMALIVLLGAVGLLLLLVCVNVANMQLARGLARNREMAIRTALGATRGRLVGQLLVENGLLVALAAGLGTLLAKTALGTIESTLALEGPVLGSVAIDARVLGFTLAVSFVAAMVSGLIPALRSAKADPNDALKAAAAGGSGYRKAGLRAAFVVVEFALVIVLLVAAGLTVKSFTRLIGVDAGFDAEHLLTARVSLPGSRYAEEPQRIAFTDAVLGELRRHGQVQAAGLNWMVPFSGREAGRIITIENQTPPEHREDWRAAPRIVDEQYFATMRIPLDRGRTFDSRDDAEAGTVMVINRTMADTFWPGEDPLGKRVRIGGEDAPWREVVGVVGDVIHMGFDDARRPEMYLPYRQAAITSFFFVVRTTGDPTAIAGSLRKIVWGVDPDQPIADVATMETLMGQSVGQSRAQTVVLATFAVVAMLLAALGIYGVMSFSVHQRRHEIGVRLALGARGTDIVGLVLRRGMGLALGGIAVGVAGALVMTRGMSSVLFDVGTADVRTYAIVATMLAVVALVANYLPARRALRGNPLRALGSD